MKYLCTQSLYFIDYSDHQSMRIFVEILSYIVTDPDESLL